MKPVAAVAAIAARLAAAAFFLATAIYALLVYVPFTYQQFILSDVIPGLSIFAAWHHVLVWIVLFLPGVQGDWSSLVVCLVSLAPVLWMAGLDVVSGRGRLVWGGDEAGEDHRVFGTALVTALFVSLTYFAIAATRTSMLPAAVSLASVGTLIALAWTVTAHLVLFGALFLALVAIRGIVRLANGLIFHEAALLFGCAVAVAALVIQWIVLAAISFTGPPANAVALAFALSLVGLWTGVSVRLLVLSRTSLRSGLDVLTAPLAFLGASRSKPSTRVLSLAAIAATAWLLARWTSTMDWNYLLQKLSAIAIWIAVFAALYAMRDTVPKAAARTAVVWLLLGAAVPAATYRTLLTMQTRAPAWLGMSGNEIRGVLDAHAGIDPSFKVIYDAVSATATGDDGEFYDLLQRNTNIPREVRVDPVAVDLVEALAPGTGRAPHIFMFVIDSLRQDHVSPYNPGVTFTPAIDAFARDSVVFKRAFTRYGATGLSQPSIWVGGLLVHKQYVMPFAPMNALQKLLTADGYQQSISRDTILRTIMPARRTDVDLDVGVQNMDYDLCRSLSDLRAKVLDPSRGDRPIFAYTQPQNIHVSRIAREGGGIEERIQKMDACFGEFVQFLRLEGLYDDSVIVLTSDHGDSLGESGRWGHAYTIFPEILRIPLIVHLPRALRGKVTCDTDAVASLVDITPTLYYLLGHRPLVNRSIFGRPLCTETPDERIATRRDWYLVASSYGPVYGILRGNGRWLYIADGVNYTDYFYDLAVDPAGAQNLVTPVVRREYQQLIGEGIEAVDRFYRPSP